MSELIYTLDNKDDLTALHYLDELESKISLIHIDTNLLIKYGFDFVSMITFRNNRVLIDLSLFCNTSIIENLCKYINKLDSKISKNIMGIIVYPNKDIINCAKRNLNHVKTFSKISVTLYDKEKIIDKELSDSLNSDGIISTSKTLEHIKLSKFDKKFNTINYCDSIADVNNKYDYNIVGSFLHNEKHQCKKIIDSIIKNIK